MKQMTSVPFSCVSPRVFSHLVLVTALGLSFLQAARASDTAPVKAPSAPSAAPAAASDKLGSARALIAAKQWPAAIEELRRVNDTTSAEWNNLMGYSLRKGKTPDLVAAQRYYDEALWINPRHRNALEYSGELYLMKNELDKAEARLATLASECGPASCEQHAELKKAIERYKGAGNQFVATW